MYQLKQIKLKTMKNSISLSNFNLDRVGYGQYNVTYISPTTGKEYASRTTDSSLIDATFNCDSPKIKDLNLLKKIAKNSCRHSW